MTLADYPKAYRPIFMFDADRLIVDHWAVGFMRGTSLRVREMDRRVAYRYAAHTCPDLRRARHGCGLPA
jgi:hypothetical protein